MFFPGAVAAIIGNTLSRPTFSSTHFRRNFPEKEMLMGSSFLRHTIHCSLLVFCVVGSVVVMPTAAQAQTRFNPDSDEVKAIVDPMVNYIKQSGGGSSLGHNVLAALAISESTKRYYGYIPEDDPVIQQAINRIVSMTAADNWVEDAGGALNTMYAPCLCVILLCDVDDKKYKPQIEKLLDFIDSRQQSHGPWGYANEPDVGDTSQVQYVSLACWVAYQHGFNVRPRWGVGILDWLTSTQRGGNFDETGGGGWGYKDGNTQRTRQPIVAAGSSSLYIISDWLGLGQKSTAAAGKKKDREDLPRDVFVHEVKNKAAAITKLVNYDSAKLSASQKAGNAWFERNFSAQENQWNYYFLYAFERYAYFREVSEGRLRGRMENWYDQGVQRISGQLNRNGNTANLPSGHLAEVDQVVTTSLGVLFLVRSTEILALGNVSGKMKGNSGFGDGTLTLRNGKLIGEEIALSTEQLMQLVDNPTDEEDLDKLRNSLATLELSDDPDQRARQVAWMRGLVTHRKYGPRFVGVRFLTNQRDLDSVPALIYALSDPADDIRRMAHDGLRFISRKIDSITLPENAEMEDYLRVKKQWELWYLSVRPDARFLDQ